jgi:Na+/melibiose symporter-like transporter
MLALTTAVHHGTHSSAVLFLIIAAIAVAAFWKSLSKIGIVIMMIVILMVGYLGMHFGSASQIVSALHRFIPLYKAIP